MSQVQAYEHLLEMDVSFSGMLDLKPDAVCRAVETDAFGADSLWSESSDMLCRHLQFLEDHVNRCVNVNCTPC